MTAIKKEELVKMEEELGLGEDGLTYQQRCSRIVALRKGEEWVAPEAPVPQEEVVVERGKNKPTNHIGIPEDHNLYGKRILITPLMVPDAKRNLAFDEKIGHEIVTRDSSAGESIYGAAEDVQRMVRDYDIISEDKNKPIFAKTTFPKIGTEISWQLGKELVPVVRGNDGQRGYIWSFPTSVMPVGDAMVQVYGLKTLIQMVWPELLSKFSGKPMMSYIDGVTLAASIPLTEALIKEHRRKEMLDAKAGLI